MTALVASLLPVLLAACGKGDGSPATGSAKSSVPSAAAAAPSTATAAQCYDLAPARGKTVVKSYTSTDYGLDGKATSRGDYTERSVVGAEVDFEGHLATETATTGNSTDSAGTRTSYSGKDYRRQTGPTEETYYGDITEAIVTFSKSHGGTSKGTTKIVHSPPLADASPGLKVGETFTVTTTLNYTQWVNGAAQPPLSSKQTHTVRFLGLEPLTIAAGTFDACKFEQFEEAGGPTSQRWLLVGHGIELKYVEPATPGVTGSTVRELTSLQVDGTAPTRATRG